MQKPFHGNEGNHRRHQCGNNDHLPILVLHGAGAVMEGFKNLVTAGGEHGWDADQKGILGGQGTAQTQNQHEQNRRARTRTPRKDSGNQLPQANGNRHRPRHMLDIIAGRVLAAAALAFAQPSFNNEKEHAARQQGDGDREKFFRKFEASFFERVTARPGNDKGRDNLKKIVAHRGISPVKNELVKALVKQGNDRQHRAGLDDDVEQIRLVRQPLLGNQKVARG